MALVPAPVAPPRWDRAPLERCRQEAILEFVKERSAEGGQRYRNAFEAKLGAVRNLFDATDDLRTLEDGKALADHAEFIEPARYLGGPPVSADDLDTLIGERIAGRRRLSLDLARKAADVIQTILDRDRLPWLFESPVRSPTAAERDIAIRWTAGLIAAQSVQTARRNEAAVRQQETVRRLLKDLGFQEVPVRRITIGSDLGRGEYCEGESLVAGTKCDVPVSLRNGRLLLVECKVSNSFVNSVKRLNREVGGKARHWREAFGQQAHTAAVLAGVYKLANLEDAQEAGVTIFWEHDLQPLADFIHAAV